MKKVLFIALFVVTLVASSACNVKVNIGTKATATPTSTTAAISTPTTVSQAVTPTAQQTPRPASTPTVSVNTPTVAVTGQTPTAATAQKTPTTAASASTPTQAAKQTPTTGTTTGSSNDALTFLKGALANQNKGPYKVSYLMTGLSADNQDEQYTISYYVKGTQTRLDTIEKNGNTTTSTRIYVNGKDQAVSCTEDAGKWTCDKSTGDAAASLAALTTSVIDATNQVASQVVAAGDPPKETKSQTLAGQNVKSYVFKAPPPTDGTVELAYTNDGILLLLEVRTTSGTDDGRMAATAFSREVPDSDFVAPA